MNDRYGRTASPAEKKGIRSSAALALAAGLVLACWGSTAQAIGEPIPGIDIVVKCLGCRPPVHGISAPTGSDGTYEFTGLAAGEYDLSIAGRRVQAISVGANRSIGGVLNRQAGGMASITINGQAAALGPAAAIVTSRDNPAGKGRDKSRGKAGIGGVDDNPADGPQGVAAEEANSALASVSTTRGRVEKPGAPDGDKTSLPGIAGDPIQGIPIGLEGDPEGMRIGTTRTDEHGAFRFDKLPAGKYRLVMAGQPDRSIGVGADGIAGGKVMHGSDGSLSIVDRLGNSVAASKAEDKKTGGEGRKNDDDRFGKFGNDMNAGPAMNPAMGGFMGASPVMAPIGPGAGGSGGAMGPRR